MFASVFCYIIYEVIFMDYSKQRQKYVHRKKLYENLNEMPFYI
ncbi:tyrosine recombinase XerS, partial [Bacillus thuringiensis]